MRSASPSSTRSRPRLAAGGDERRRSPRSPRGPRWRASLERYAPRRAAAAARAPPSARQARQTRCRRASRRAATGRSDGLEIWVGQERRRKRRLTTRLARGKDLFFHLEGSPGSHVVLRTEGRERSAERVAPRGRRARGRTSRARRTPRRAERPRRRHQGRHEAEGREARARPRHRGRTLQPAPRPEAARARPRRRALEE